MLNIQQFLKKIVTARAAKNENQLAEIDEDFSRSFQNVSHPPRSNLMARVILDQLTANDAALVKTRQQALAVFLDNSRRLYENHDFNPNASSYKADRGIYYKSVSLTGFSTAFQNNFVEKTAPVAALETDAWLPGRQNLYHQKGYCREIANGSSRLLDPEMEIFPSGKMDVDLVFNAGIHGSRTVKHGSYSDNRIKLYAYVPAKDVDTYNWIGGRYRHEFQRGSPFLYDGKKEGFVPEWQDDDSFLHVPALSSQAEACSVIMHEKLHHTLDNLRQAHPKDPDLTRRFHYTEADHNLAVASHVFYVPAAVNFELYERNAEEVAARNAEDYFRQQFVRPSHHRTMN